jgi:hypothetical protein
MEITRRATAGILAGLALLLLAVPAQAAVTAHEPVDAVACSDPDDMHW